MLIGGTATFAVTGVALLAAGAWVSVRYVFPHDGWLGIGHALLLILILPLIGALAATAMVLRFVGPAEPVRSPRFDLAPRITPRRWRHERKGLGTAIRLQLALIPVAALTTWAARLAFPVHRAYPAWLDLVIFHALLCGLLVVCFEIVFSFLELIHRGKRFRARAVIVQRLAAAWPVTFAAITVAVEALAG
jgi:hypothetical protein